MSSPQRNVSTPLELHELNLVTKQNVPALPARNRSGEQQQQRQDNRSPLSRQVGSSNEKFPPVTPKKNLIAPVTPVKKPMMKEKPEDENSTIYKLASKKREINELEEKLKFLKMELHELEVEFRKSQPQMAQSQMIQRQVQFQETFDGLKSRFNNTISSFTAPTNTEGSQPTQGNNGTINAGQTNRFFKGLMEKFNEFNVNEDEFDTKTKREDVNNAYYLKQGYELDDEEIEKEAHDEARFLNKIDDSTINSIRR
ncbi:similar to Saccharomyces cerevisiae YJR083C ACF4 Protein of unknown function [Maudiozyma barnettii]|uniref:Uncharacterized protein n=1 Tax=Maudiozyma barnettii TaxID=61262 RepID=A0A8H2ZHC7_9SACH|nr:Acf4p [Kazachstania barnettii]CAB4254633.1 similar to Saccharomyces cerevisiae YJR083C ACF4 Protein of unknown function [Kazachstania barnettii]CAD1782675.1 similar to Saccharomyces cerevisiae YJR083C ACF4 Protein of unknown function [Kazachstania barnettii]